MEYLPVTVRSHSGYKADERPLGFIWLEKEYDISDILDRWYQTDRDPDIPPADYFKVKTETGIFILRHELETDRWYLVI